MLQLASRALGVTILGGLLILQVPQDMQRQVDRSAEKLESMDYRVRSIESMHIEGQLAAMNQTLNDDHHLLQGMTAVMFLTGMETLFRYTKKRLSKREAEE